MGAGVSRATRLVSAKTSEILLKRLTFTGSNTKSRKSDRPE